MHVCAEGEKGNMKNFKDFVMDEAEVKEILKSLPRDENLFSLYEQVTGSFPEKWLDDYYRKNWSLYYI